MYYIFHENNLHQFNSKTLADEFLLNTQFSIEPKVFIGEEITLTKKTVYSISENVEKTPEFCRYLIGELTNDGIFAGKDDEYEYFISPKLIYGTYNLVTDESCRINFPEFDGIDGSIATKYELSLIYKNRKNLINAFRNPNIQSYQIPFDMMSFWIGSSLGDGLSHDQYNYNFDFSTNKINRVEKNEGKDLKMSKFGHEMLKMNHAIYIKKLPLN